MGLRAERTWEVRHAHQPRRPHDDPGGAEERAVQGWGVASSSRGDTAGFLQSPRLPDPQGLNISLTQEPHVHPQTGRGRSDLGRRVGVTAEK